MTVEKLSQGDGTTLQTTLLLESKERNNLMTATPQTPETVQQLLARQEQKEEEVNMLQLGLKALQGRP